MRIKFLILTVCVILLAAFFAKDLSAAKQHQFTVREDYGAFDADYDQPLRATAIIAGWCRDVSIPLSDSRQIMNLYHIKSEDVDGVNLSKVGVLYYDDRGREAVCLDEMSVHPFIAKNVRGEMVTVLGWIASGSQYKCPEDKIIVVESMERLGEDLE